MKSNSERVDLHPLIALAVARKDGMKHAMDKTFSILTFGCKLNQFESERMRQSLIRREWVFKRFEEGANFCIINSCTVTGRSDARCRRAVRRARTASPHAYIVVTGCYAETSSAALSAMDEVDLVIGNQGKESLAAVLDAVAAGNEATHPIPSGAARVTASAESEIESFLDHSRAFVKIQDGCDASCGYCIVPRARGPSKSVDAEAVLRQIRVLAAHGYREIVLAGIHIGRYGADCSPPSTLSALIKRILAGTSGLRVRLSSIEPTEVTPPLVELLAHEDRLAPHLHVPLQSGDDGILEAMDRPYRSWQFRRTIETVARARTGLGLGTDLMVGFPGETEERFERTVSLARDLPLSFFHVFPFSPRPGTPAASMPDQVNSLAKKQRSKRLIELGASKKRSFLDAQVGTEQLVLVEGGPQDVSPFARCLTGNYCTVRVPRQGIVPGTLARIRVTHLTRDTLYGIFLGGEAHTGSRTGGGA